MLFVLLKASEGKNVGLTKLVVCMPHFNEGNKVVDFVQRLEAEFSQQSVIELSFVVVDDCSSEDARLILNKLHHVELHYFVNDKNLGHGPSTLRALREALLLKPHFICAADGDGEIEASAIKQMVHKLVTSNFLIVEGVRANRSDAWFRKLATFVTRKLVHLRSRKSPRDSNTPFRAYRPEVLSALLKFVPNNSMIPNLHISAMSRTLEVPLLEVPVAIRDALNGSLGITWQAKFRTLPSRRFIIFCIRAAAEWMRSCNGPRAAPTKQFGDL